MKPTYPCSRKAEGNADQSDDPAHPFVDGQRARADVRRAQRHDLVDQSQQARARLRKQHDLAPVVEPYLEHQNSHQIPHVHIPEHGHGRGAVRSKVHLRRAQRMAQVQNQRQGRNQQERQGRQQRKPVGGFHRLYTEDALQRRQDECARHQPRDVGVQNDQHTPIECDFVRIHVAFNTVHKPSLNELSAFSFQLLEQFPNLCGPKKGRARCLFLKEKAT